MSITMMEGSLPMIDRSMDMGVPSKKFTIPTGLVLAGGRSRRMKTEKALLSFRGKTLIKRTLDLLRWFCDDVYISCRSDQKGHFSMLAPLIFDDGTRGPLGGVLAGMEGVGTSLLVTTCDMPFITPKTIEMLLNKRKPEMSGTFFQHDSGYLQPFPGLFEKAILPTLRTRIDHEEYGVIACLNQSTIQKVPIKDSLAFENWNRPEDVRL